jgi:diguanylate cyclase (GGDEF)-like protein/putative nucleotidyltransferase with HDIG domain
MTNRHLKPISDEAEIEFRRNNVVTGCWMTLATCASVLVYYALSRHGAHRLLETTIVGSTAVMVSVFLRLPLRRLVMSRWREPFFVLWSTATMVVAFTLVALEGRTASSLRATFFLPILYAGMSYPRGLAALVGALNVGAFAADAVLLHIPVAHAVYMILALSLGTAMCVWQATIRDRQRDELRSQRDELERVSRSDPLTGCLNRRGFEERFEAELAAATRAGTPLALALIDLDDFKAVNDRDGHAAGDALLCIIVERLAAALRPNDVLGRQGGDEFAIALPGASATDAEEIVERLSRMLAGISPASIGLACFPEHGTDSEELQHHADAQLYAAKHGRATVTAGRRELGWATALADAVDRRMDAEHEHSRAVADLAAAIAERLDWNPAQCGLLRLAAILHDVGKVAIPDRILCKPGRLTDDEYEQMKTHPDAGARIVARIDGLEPIVSWIRHSHEHVNGSGYPDGLAGDAIPLASRILLAADAFDAMTSDRPYRQAMRTDDAIVELRRHAGRQFDPVCVEVLAALVAERDSLASLSD